MALGRGLDPTFLAALGPAGFNPVLLVWIDWPGAPVRAHTGVGNMSFAGETWTGVGGFGRVSIPGDAMGLASGAATVELVGIDGTLDGYLNDNPRGAECEIWFGATTERAGNVLIGTPDRRFVGSVASFGGGWQSTPEGRMRNVTVEMRPGPSQRSAAVLMHSNADQQAKFPGDTAGRHMENMKTRFTVETWPE